MQREVRETGNKILNLRYDYVPYESRTVLISQSNKLLQNYQKTAEVTSL